MKKQYKWRAWAAKILSENVKPIGSTRKHLQFVPSAEALANVERIKQCIEDEMRTPLF